MKNYIERFRKGGITWLWMCIVRRINKLCFYIFQICPLDKSLIIFESEGDFCDNAYALYSYMLEHGYMEKYRAVWLVENKERFSEDIEFENTRFCYKADDKLNFFRNYYLAVCGHYIYDHCLMMYRKRKGQRITYLSHGAGFKARKGGGKTNLNGLIDEIFATGPVAGDYLSYFHSYDRSKVKEIGYSRNDYFYTDLSVEKGKLNRRYGFSDYKMIILWMPTFRKSRSLDISEDYLDSGTGLPVFDTIKKLGDFNQYLGKKNYLMVLKVHQLTADLPIYKEKFSNILILMNEDIHVLDMQLYQFIGYTDILITDYSSISRDYLLIDKPCIYTLDDYEQYSQSRGIFPPNAIDYMAGYHVKTANDLIEAIDEICSGIDKYADKRAEVREKYHTYKDGDSSRRIVKYLGL